ncbi:hypothetical protein CQA53_00450 [Helicobacter didelphidarum]|uniref:DUF2393 domain-containing protein n=1 Tax=Helicobacter didelphidarum TaxID=2040648 RepID=A0A3D8IRH3_9HELI|nr:DUF2393 family protein [Helicobacter didelphidarum]RDU67526.1 hypothetical protein CQA53_00450 [Helicobacter didelphidarum]
MKEKITEFFSYFHWYDMILFSALALLAMCLIFLSFLTFRKRIISILCFLLGFTLIIAIPFVVRYFLEERLYKVEIKKAYDSVYNYSEVYQYIANITNVGKRNIAGCIMSHQILYDTSKTSGFTKIKYIALNYAKPKYVYNKEIPMDLKVGQSVDISEVMENYPYRGEPYTTKIECYGVKKYGDEVKRLQGVYLPKTEQQDDASVMSKEEPQSDEETIDDSLDSKVKTNIQENKQDLEQDTKNLDTQTSVQEKQQQNNILPPIQNDSETQTQNHNLDQQFNNTDSLSQNPPHSEQPNNQIPNIIPPQDNGTQIPDWREKRDNFNIPLLKETPR